MLTRQAMYRAYYDADISSFLEESTASILGKIAIRHAQEITHTQTNAWTEQVSLLKLQLKALNRGHVFLEFVIPRMGKRADAILLVSGILFVIEFKVGSAKYLSDDGRQLEGYALDLKDFHSGSHDLPIIPILVATETASGDFHLTKPTGSNVFEPINSNGQNLSGIMATALAMLDLDQSCNPIEWMNSSYKPTPTIIEAAQALYAQHSVDEIARSDAGAKNLAETSTRIREIVARSKSNNCKSICFVTGVPGSGKTLVGLDLATSSASEEPAVFLSGNGPLVDVLREALTRDEVRRFPGMTKMESSRKVRSFVQNIHHFRDEALQSEAPPSERVVVFDEAQRAWDSENTSKFMVNKRGQPGFNLSEPEFLIQYLNRHEDWCVIVALIGGGQEINTGEAGLSGWRDAIEKMFPCWDVYYSDRLHHGEYVGIETDFSTLANEVCSPEPALHLMTSMRSFRAESLSTVIHHLIKGNASHASRMYSEIRANYPIRITRSLTNARAWISQSARGMDAKGLIASSGANRLKPNGIFVKNVIAAPFWFLNPPEDVRSCHALEDVATEFVIQGLELDWTIVAWDADLRFQGDHFEHWAFKGSKWQRVHKSDAKRFLENAYRVLLTRARQGMVIFVPEGSEADITRDHRFYDETYTFLLNCGFEEI